MKKLTTLFLLFLTVFAQAAEETAPLTLDDKINNVFTSTTGGFVDLIFKSIPFGDYGVQWIVLWLAIGGIICTLVFKFINFSGFKLALNTVKGKYTSADAPGQITHFQALSTAVSGTVGLGNIAGVAIGIAIGGPGVAFWLFLMGFFGMATKFAECTLGVKYRKIDSEGNVSGGAMHYLKDGFAERGLAPVGVVLAFLFAIFCILASFGGGNIFQVNQVTSQLIKVTGEDASFFANKQWLFGLIMAILTGLVIIGGVKSIAKVTSKLVPAMCLTYVVSALIVLLLNIGEIPGAIAMIVNEAFNPRAAVAGGFLGAFIWGIKRSTFSNEAGIGSAPIAHAAVKTEKPASEGLVALLEPFIDTIVVCTMTSLVIVIGMQFDGDSSNYTVNGQSFTLGDASGGTSFGIALTSNAFENVFSGFKYILFACVSLFAFSTLITWSYYGLTAWQFLFGKNNAVALAYKIIFCLIIIVGSAIPMSAAIDFSDASLFAMAIPNLIGVYFLIPMVKKELADFKDHAQKIDDQS